MKYIHNWYIASRFHIRVYRYKDIFFEVRVHEGLELLLYDEHNDGYSRLPWENSAQNGSLPQNVGHCGGTNEGWWLEIVDFDDIHRLAAHGREDEGDKAEC